MTCSSRCRRFGQSVDTKVRGGSPGTVGDFKVIGWDGVGTVEAAGDAVTLFKPGGRLVRRLDCAAGLECRAATGRRAYSRAAPRSLGDAEAAALPLTALTAWEMLFDRLDVNRPVPERQPHSARHRRGRWGWLDRDPDRQTGRGHDGDRNGLAPGDCRLAKAMGADHVVDHSKPLAEVAALGIGAPRGSSSRRPARISTSTKSQNSSRRRRLGNHQRHRRRQPPRRVQRQIDHVVLRAHVHAIAARDTGHGRAAQDPH